MYILIHLSPFTIPPIPVYHTTVKSTRLETKVPVAQPGNESDHIGNLNSSIRNKIPYKTIQSTKHFNTLTLV